VHNDPNAAGTACDELSRVVARPTLMIT